MNPAFSENHVTSIVTL